MVGRIGLNLGRRSRKAAIVAMALIFAVIGAHSLNPRELFREMYPIEPVKQDAFHICQASDPTFVRAVGVEREACYDKMPHIMAVAMGRAKPGGALSMEAMVDPSREAELIMMLASMPPQQPITQPRLFSNTAWVRALSSGCAQKPALPAVASNGARMLPPPPGSGRAAALDGVIRGNLPPLPRPTKPSVTAQPDPLPVIPLTPGGPAATQAADKAGTFTPLSAPDIGDQAPPAIVPLAPATSCSGA